MGNNCAPLAADLFLFCYEMLSLSGNNQTDIIEAINATSRYLDDLLIGHWLDMVYLPPGGIL